MLGMRNICRVAPRRGVGRLLFAAAERRLLADGVRYLTVKTLSATDPETPNT
jgi:hypothetical protein